MIQAAKSVLSGSERGFPGLGAITGPTGMNVVIKLSAFLLVCIGVQLLWNGASQLLNVTFSART